MALPPGRTLQDMAEKLHIPAAIPGASNSNITMSERTELGKQLLKAMTERKDNVALSDLIRRGADLNYKDEKGDSPLFLAARTSTIPLCRFLLEHGAVQGILSALFFAASTGQKDLCGLLIGRGVNVTVKDNAGQTCLHYSARNGHFDVSRLLLELGIDATIKNPGGKRALDLAKAAGHGRIVDLLEHRIPLTPAPEPVAVAVSKKRKLEDCNEDIRSLTGRAETAEALLKAEMGSRERAEQEVRLERERRVAAEIKEAVVSAVLESAKERIADGKEREERGRAEGKEREERGRARAVATEKLIGELRERAARAEAKCPQDARPDYSRDVVAKRERTV